MPGSSWMTLCFIAWNLSLAITQTPESDRVGTAVNILKNFGDLDLELRVTPRNDTDPWVFNSDPVYVLKNFNRKRTSYNINTGAFRMELCRGPSELMESFFRYQTIEGVDQPWRAFSKSWSPIKESRTLGLNSALSNEVGYVLLKMDLRKEEYAMISEDIELSKMAGDYFGKISVNNSSSVRDFQNRIGTHYVHSYSTGFSIFQVLVYSLKEFEYLETRMTDTEAPNMTYARVGKYFSPQFAKDIGRIMVTSGNHNTVEWINGLLTRTYGATGTRYSSLFSLMWRPWLVDQFEKVEPNAITSIRLNLIDRAMNESKEKEYFKEITANLIQLNEEHV